MNKAEHPSSEPSAPVGGRKIARASGSLAPSAQPWSANPLGPAAYRIRPSWRHSLPLALAIVSAVPAHAADSGPVLTSGGTIVDNPRLAAALGHAAVSPLARTWPQLAPSVVASEGLTSAPRRGPLHAPAPQVAPADPARFASLRLAPASVTAVSQSTMRAELDEPAATHDNRATRPALRPEVTAHVVNLTASVATSGGTGVVHVTSAPAHVVTAGAAMVSAPSPTASVPPVGLTANYAKVISVSGLQLPPLSQPLPVWMQAAALHVDRLGSNELPPAAPQTMNGMRLAEDATAAPVREPDNPVTSSDHLPNQIEVAVSTYVVLLTTSDLQTVAVADPSIADVAVVNSRAVLVNGKAPGVTSLVIVDGQKIRQYSIRVTNAPGTNPEDVADAIGIPGVTVRPLRDALVLEGEVASDDESKRAAEIAGIYSAKVINHLTIRGFVSTNAGIASDLQNLINMPGVTVRASGDSIVLTGTVDTPQEMLQAEALARTTGKSVVDLLQLPPLTVDQVRAALGAQADYSAQTTGYSGAIPLVVKEAGGSIVLDGQLTNQSQVDAALAMANRTGLTVVNRLSVLPPLTSDQVLASTVQAAIGRPGVRVSGTIQRLVLEGVVPDTNTAVICEQIARAWAKDVDNMLVTPDPQTIDVDVQIAEVDKSDLNSLGVTYGEDQITSESITTSSVPIGTNAAGATINEVEPITNVTLNPNYTEGQVTTGNGYLGQNSPGSFTAYNPMRAIINALYTNGKSRLLSNPHTTVLSGRTATFQVGGEVPYPSGTTTNGSGTSTAITFKEYGVLVDIVPVVSKDGAVTMRVRTEVSAPDPTTGITLPGGGSLIPGFTTRASVTEVTVPRGGVLSLSGMIQNNITKNLDKIPILSNLPILGSLFQSKRFQRSQTELVIFVTPRVLPNPLKPGEVAAASPVAVGNNSNIATIEGNPGIAEFNTGTAISSAAATSPGGTGGSASSSP